MEAELGRHQPGGSLKRVCSLETRLGRSERQECKSVLQELTRLPPNNKSAPNLGGSGNHPWKPMRYRVFIAVLYKVAVVPIWIMLGLVAVFNWDASGRSEEVLRRFEHSKPLKKGTSPG